LIRILANPGQKPYFCITMLLQEILLGITFLGAVAYLGSLGYKSLHAKSGCASGCGKCNAVDFAKIEQQIKAKKL
jgi:hypothetical protein